PTESFNVPIPASPRRVQPDISLNGDPYAGLVIFYDEADPNGCHNDCLGGGTSASSPLLAGIVVLAAQHAGGGQVGSINPFIYSNSGSLASIGIFDVTSGYNGVNAHPGWDYTTGLGSIKNAL